METIPRDLDKWRQFDRYCKLVLRHEAIDYLRERRYRRDHETALSAVPKAELDKLCTVDNYPSDNFIFSAHGCSLPISNEQVAEAFASLSARAQSILILRFTLDLTDREIGAIMGLSRSTVQEHRKKTLDTLRAKLAALMPEGGKA